MGALFVNQRSDTWLYSRELNWQSSSSLSLGMHSREIVRFGNFKNLLVKYLNLQMIKTDSDNFSPSWVGNVGMV